MKAPAAVRLDHTFITKSAFTTPLLTPGVTSVVRLRLLRLPISLARL
jgi:hypothetical protein